MRLEIVIRDELAPNERIARMPISIEGLHALNIQEQKNVLWNTFLLVYYDMTGESWS